MYIKLREELVSNPRLSDIFRQQKYVCCNNKKCSVKIMLIEEIANGMTDKDL